MLNFILYLFYNNIIITFAYINLKHEIMGRKKIVDRGEIKKSFTLVVEDKYLINQNKDELRNVAYSAIVNHVSKNGK